MTSSFLRSIVRAVFACSVVGCFNACDTIELTCNETTTSLTVILQNEDSDLGAASIPAFMAVCFEGRWVVQASTLTP